MAGERSRVLAWAEAGVVPAERLHDALRLLGVLPAAEAWRRFVDRLTLFAGAAALGTALVFFVAANWAAIGRFGKFALVEAVVVAAVLGFAARSDRASGKAALLVAALALGALLALVGQTYQTGADTFELFASWAALILPWALVGRLPALWVMWIALLDLGVLTYFAQDSGPFSLLPSSERPVWWVAALDTAALAAWEAAALRVSWLRERWAPRALALTAGAAATGLMLHAIVDWRRASAVIPVAYPLWLAAGVLVYRRRIPDLFMLAAGCLSVIVVVTTFLGHHLIDDDYAETFLLVGVAVIVMAGAAALWLRRVAQEEERG